jgi:hypothetical protein
MQTVDPSLQTGRACHTERGRYTRVFIRGSTEALFPEFENLRTRSDSCFFDPGV